MYLEKMADFFEARLESYEEHMLNNIDSAEEFYPFTAAQLPDAPGASVLDLGCGTGLELRWYYARNPAARVTGIDLSEGMLNALAERYASRKPVLICGSYFDVPLGEGVYDAAVSQSEIRSYIGRGPRHLITEALPKEAILDEPQLVDKALAIYDKMYAKTYLQTNTLYDGIEARRIC